jgi:hypothetical protein
MIAVVAGDRTVSTVIAVIAVIVVSTVIAR